jgi:flagellar motor switch protein FliM
VTDSGTGSPFLTDEAQPTTRSAAAEARPFTLGSKAFQPAARLAGLERMAERIARGIRTIVEPLVRVRTDVVPQPLETVMFGAWKETLPSFTSISLFRVRPMKAGILVALEPEFLARLVDTYYGGTGRGGRPNAREFTPIEDQMLARVTGGVIDQLVETWSEVITLSPSLGGRETKADYATLVRPDEPVVVQAFLVNPSGHMPTVLSLVYSLAAIRPYEAQLSAKVHEDAGPADADWRGRMAHALENVRLPVRSVLARPELSVSQLMQLKVGDVIPITLAPKAPLIVANRRFAHGTIGEREGRAALMIEKVGNSGE